MSILRSFVLAATLLLGVTAPHAAAQRPGDKPLTPQGVRDAISNGVDYLRRNQRNGSWDHHLNTGGSYPGGVTCLIMLALLEAGEDPKSEYMRAGLAYVRNLNPPEVYVRSLQTMVLAKGDPKGSRFELERNVEWLKDAMRRDRQTGTFLGWSYRQEDRRVGVRIGMTPDNSNSQYAVLALHFAQEAGVMVDAATWKEIQDYYKRTQLRSGGWPYQNEGGQPGDRITMTAAGVCGLLISGMQLYKNLEERQADGSFKNCGRREENEVLAKGLTRLADTFTLRAPLWMFYNLYGIERAGRLSGMRFFQPSGLRQPYDWYREGAQMLVNSQRPDGSWRGDHVNTFDSHPMIATSFSLLFLSKGKTPVLIHKMMHGPLPRSLGGDWNNDPNDVRNLTDYCSQQVFKKDGRPVPLTWQAFDASRLPAANADAVAEMLQAPVLYLSGHLPLELTEREEKLLVEFVEQGGFIFAEACCGRKEFADSFRALVHRLWEGKRTLEPLADDDPIWSAAFRVPPRSFNLEGVKFGCKTSIVLAPRDLSCFLESNKLDDPDVLLAFRTAANVIAYATGLEAPKDKLETIHLTSKREDPIQRNFLQVGQIKYSDDDWQPAPKAMRNLMDYVRERYRVDVIAQTKPIPLGSPNLYNHKFLYMHGRRALSFTDEGGRSADVPPQHVKNLRRHLESGAILLADACCGSEQFDQSFRELMRRAFPDRKLEPIAEDDPLFSDKVGKEITLLQCRTRRGAPYAAVKPQLEGIRLHADDPKSPWIVIYSKYDLGCALDRHTSGDCLGYNHESALELAAQVVLYALKE